MRDIRTPIIYLLLLIIMMLLVVLKRVDDRATELEKMLNLIEKRYEKIPEIITPPNLQPRNKDEKKKKLLKELSGLL